MANIATLFIIAVIALQGSNAASLKQPKLNNLEEVVEAIGETTKEIQDVNHFISIHLSPLIPEIEYEIEAALLQHESFPFLETLRNTIIDIEKQLESIDGAQKCIDSTLRFVVLITEETKRAIDDCVAPAREAGGNLKIFVETLQNEADTILNELAEEFHTCMISNTETEVLIECLWGILEPVNAKLADLQDKVTNAKKEGQKIIEDAIRNLNICLQKVEQDLRLKAEFALDTLLTCVENTKTLQLRQPRALDSIVDFFRELKEKLDFIIHLATHLPTSFDELQDAINEIISHFNIALIVSQTKTEIDQLIDEGGRNAEKCRPDADAKIDEIVKSSEDASKVCMEAAGSSVDQIKAAVDALVDEGQKLLKDINDDMLNCFWENPINPINFYKCLEGKYDEYKQKVLNLQDKANELLENSKEQAKEIVQDLAKCMNSVQINTVKEGQTLIASVEDCIRLS